MILSASKLKVVFFTTTLLLTPLTYAASSDEIQVYDDAINEVGELNVDVHVNYVANGVQASAYPREIPSNHDFRIPPEFAYGLTKNFEAGLYLPFIRCKPR